MRKTWKGGSFTGDPGRCVKEGSGDVYLSPEGHRWGTWKRAPVPGTLKDERRRDLGMGHLPTRTLYEGNLEGEFLYWGNGRLFLKRPRFGVTFRDAPFLGPLREGKIFFI